MRKSYGCEAETRKDATDIVDHDAAKKPDRNKKKNRAGAATDFESAWVACRKHGWQPKRNSQNRTGDKPENKSAVRELVGFGSPRKTSTRKGEEASAESCAYEQDGTREQWHKTT
ncbi:MAG: hypothetical protein ACK4R8_10650 [Thiobacillus sp.]